MDPAEIFLIRHGIRRDFEDPDWKLTASEPNDPPLAESGLRQAGDIARAMAGSGIQPIRAIYCSPFLRALQTAAPAAKLLGVPVRIEPGFGEWLSPEFFSVPPRLLSLAEAAAVCPTLDAGYIPVHTASGLEESETREVRSRVRLALETIQCRAPSESFAVFTHGSPLCQAAAELLGSLDGVDTRMGSITRVERGGDGCFVLVGSGCDHLGDADSHLRFH
jgi:broad specificity phosphatase PhoE